MSIYNDKHKGRESNDRLLSDNQTPLQSAGQLGTAANARVQEITEQILERFEKSLPSNYVAKVRGTNYQHLFRSLAEQLALIQLHTEMNLEDADYSLTRSDFLYQVLGKTVFPNADLVQGQFPEIPGNITHQTFLREMVVLLLQGAKHSPVEKGPQLLADVGVDIIEKTPHIYDDQSKWNIYDQFSFELNLMALKGTMKHGHHWHRIEVDSNGNGKTTGTYVERGKAQVHVHKVVDFVIQPYVEADGTEHTHEAVQAFPNNPFILKQNVELIMMALKPAHTLYEYRHVFVELFGDLFSADYSWQQEQWHYEDHRKSWRGVKDVERLGQSERQAITEDVSSQFLV